MTSSARHIEGVVLVWTPAVALAVYFFGLAFATATSEYALIDLLMLAVVYGLLAVALHSGSLLLTRMRPLLGLLGAFATGAVVVWHLREQTLVPVGYRGFVALSAGVGIAYFVVCLVTRRLALPSLLAARCAVSALLFIVTLAVFFHVSDTFRWHLLRHNKLLGTPAYYALARPIGTLRRALWEANAKGSGVPAPTAAPLFAGSANVDRPNLVFILVDTLRADALAAYGGAPDLMPELNRFAEQSVVFTDVLSNASWTRPSVASFFTGLLPEEHGAVDRSYGLAGDYLTLAEVLSSEGYRTAAFVSNFAAVGRDAGFAQGFDHFQQLDGSPFPYARAERVNDAVKSWLRPSPRGDAPLFLYVHYLDPHKPYLSGGVTGAPRGGAERLAYDAELRYLDGLLGSLLDRLRRRLDGPLFVLVTSDHGEEFGEHGEGGHGHSLYAEVIRLPALLWSRQGWVRTIAEKLEARDFFDLLLYLSRSADPDAAEWAAQRARATRYASIYSTTPSAWHRPYRSRVCMRGFESDDLFLIWSAYGPTYELYEVQRDPGERRNLARAHRDRIDTLMGAMEDSVGPWAELTPVDHSDATVDLLRTLGYVE